MSTQYRVYGNGGAGGPVDYSAPLATTASTTWTPPPLAPGSDWTFAVRAFDTASGLEEKNLSARVRVETDPSGADVTGRPAAPRGVTAQARAGGKVRVRFLFEPRGRPAPLGFAVFVGTPEPDYSSAAAVIPYYASLKAYSTGPDHAPAGDDPSGLAEGVTYKVAVRAFNASGYETNPATAAAVGSASGPQAVDPVSASATP